MSDLLLSLLWITDAVEQTGKQKKADRKGRKDANSVLRPQVCLMVSGIVTEGLQDLLIQYFKLLFNFTVRDVVRGCRSQFSNSSLHRAPLTRFC